MGGPRGLNLTPPTGFTVVPCCVDAAGRGRPRNERGVYGLGLPECVPRPWGAASRVTGQSLPQFPPG